MYQHVLHICFSQQGLWCTFTNVLVNVILICSLQKTPLSLVRYLVSQPQYWLSFSTVSECQEPEWSFPMVSPLWLLYCLLLTAVWYEEDKQTFPCGLLHDFFLYEWVTDLMRAVSSKNVPSKCAGIGNIMYLLHSHEHAHRLFPLDEWESRAQSGWTADWLFQPGWRSLFIHLFTA